MVRAVDIEALFQKYLDENNLEKCDALYLLYTMGAEKSAKILRVRYGRAGAISSVLEDLKELGIQEIRSHDATEDTREYIKDVVEESFKRMCLNSIINSSKERAKNLSQTARELLYLISVYYSVSPELIDIEELYKFYRMFFQKHITKPDFNKALDELISCYVIQEADIYIYFPPYLSELLNELREFMPEVEVKVSWRKEQINHS